RKLLDFEGAAVHTAAMAGRFCSIRFGERVSYAVSAPSFELRGADLAERSGGVAHHRRRRSDQAKASFACAWLSKRSPSSSSPWRTSLAQRAASAIGSLVGELQFSSPSIR